MLADRQSKLNWCCRSLRLIACITVAFIPALGLAQQISDQYPPSSKRDSGYRSSQYSYSAGMAQPDPEAGRAARRAASSPGSGQSARSSGRPDYASAISADASGSSSRHLRDQARQRVPLDELPPELQAKVEQLVSSPSVYRQLPVTTIDTDPDLYLFLLRYPETILNIWQIMGVTQMTAERVASFRMKFEDGVGTAGNLRLIYGTPHLNIYYGEGIYEGPLLFRKVRGKCLIVVSTRYHRDAQGRPQTTSTLDMFMKIDHLAASIIAKTVHPLVGSTADHNFVETLKFVEKLSAEAGENAGGMHRLAQRLTLVRPEVRHRFEQIIDLVDQRNFASLKQGPVQ